MGKGWVGAGRKLTVISFVVVLMAACSGGSDDNHTPAAPSGSDVIEPVPESPESFAITEMHPETNCLISNNADSESQFEFSQFSDSHAKYFYWECSLPYEGSTEQAKSILLMTHWSVEQQCWIPHATQMESSCIDNYSAPDVIEAKLSASIDDGGYGCSNCPPDLYRAIITRPRSYVKYLQSVSCLVSFTNTGNIPIGGLTYRPNFPAWSVSPVPEAVDIGIMKPGDSFQTNGFGFDSPSFLIGTVQQVDIDLFHPAWYGGYGPRLNAGVTYAP